MKTYNIEEVDNGWIIRDIEAETHEVIEEGKEDREHNKFKMVLGRWLLEDIDMFLDMNLVNKCKVTIKIENDA